MKSFDEIVEELFRWSDYNKGRLGDREELKYYTLVYSNSPYPPYTPNIIKYKVKTKDTPRKGIIAENDFSFSEGCLEAKYVYSKAILEPFYGKDVNEPIVKICKRILEKPTRFKTLKESLSIKRDGSYDLYIDKIIILDKDTQQRFVFENEICTNPSFLTSDESKLLYKVVIEWKEHRL